jgi:hypothetical protein
VTRRSAPNRAGPERSGLRPPRRVAPGSSTVLGEPWPGVPVRGRGGAGRANACWRPCPSRRAGGPARRRQFCRVCGRPRIHAARSWFVACEAYYRSETTKDDLEPPRSLAAMGFLPMLLSGVSTVRSVRFFSCAGLRPRERPGFRTSWHTGAPCRYVDLMEFAAGRRPQMSWQLPRGACGSGRCQALAAVSTAELLASLPICEDALSHSVLLSCELGAGHDSDHVALVATTHGGDQWWWLRWDDQPTEVIEVVRIDPCGAELLHDSYADQCHLPESHFGPHSYDVPPPDGPR